MILNNYESYRDNLHYYIDFKTLMLVKDDTLVRGLFSFQVCL